MVANFEAESGAENKQVILDSGSQSSACKAEYGLKDSERPNSGTPGPSRSRGVRGLTDPGSVRPARDLVIQPRGVK